LLRGCVRPAFGTHTVSAAGTTERHCSDAARPAAGLRAAAGPVTVRLAGDSTMADPSAVRPVGWGGRIGALFTGEAGGYLFIRFGLDGSSPSRPGTPGPVGAFFCNDRTHFEAYDAQRVADRVAGDVRPVTVRGRHVPLAGYLR
jgi:hypothetical protein